MTPDPHADLTASTGRVPASLRCIDWFLWPELRTEGALKRGRILVGSLLLMGATTWLLALATGAWHATPTSTAVSAFAMSGYPLALAVARWRRSLVLGTVGLSLTMSLSLLFVAMHEDSAFLALTPWQAVLPLFVLYIVGTRWALLISAAIAIEVLMVWILHALGSTLPPLGLPSPMWAGTLAAITAVFAAAWVGSLHLSAAAQARAALLVAHRDAQAQQANMASVLESTDDPICLLDRELCLVSANGAAHGISGWLYGVPPESGRALSSILPADELALWTERFDRVRTGDRVRVEEHRQRDGRELSLDVCINPVWSDEGAIAGFAVFARDITDRVAAEGKLKAVHRQLVDVSRQAGMAEVATSILHNVGNTLNSVTVSASLIKERLAASRVTSLARAAGLLAAQGDQAGRFIADDARGRRLPEFLCAVSDRLVEERRVLAEELGRLTASIQHIKAIVRMQQVHARTVSLIEDVDLEEVTDEALRLLGAAFDEQRVTVARDHGPDLPRLMLDRHRLLQIFVNLLTNARHAVIASGRPDKCVVVSIRADAACVRLQVIDNGVGISEEHLPLLFQQGFTTKRDGHGFGLHSSAIAAAELGAVLSCSSEGAGRGATFTLELPLARSSERAA
jgi:PAS domain S-box-containing protein